MNKQERAYLVLFAQAFPEFPAELLEQFRRLARKYHRLNEWYCNGWIAEEEFNGKTARIEKRAAQLLPAGLLISFETDPRGAPIRVARTERPASWWYIPF